MRQTLWSVSLVIFAFAVTVGLLAQAPNSSAPQATKQVVTYSGCVEKAPSEKAPTDEVSPAGAAPAASTQFILTNATPTATTSAAGTTTATTSAVGTTGSAKPAAKYRLVVDEAKISPHVGHKVEVTGTIEEQPAPAGGAATSTAAAGAATSTAVGPKFKVDSIKMIAAECK